MSSLKCNIFISFFFAVLPNYVLAQSWNYNVYGTSGSLTPGSITLEEKDGQYTFIMYGGRLDKCLARPLKAVVEKSDATITIFHFHHSLGVRK